MVKGLSDRVIRSLQDIFTPEFVLTGEEDLHCYSFDGSGSCRLPQAVVFPQKTEQVASLMKLASQHLIPVVPRGAGSGMTGGALPVAGGIVVVFSRMNKVIEVDSANMIAVLEPGVITGDLQKELAGYGLFYPVDPASLKFCTVGGNAAECAGGPSAVKYGVTRDYIIGCEAVLANGEVIATGVRTEKGVVGYDLTRLLVGSEGTLAIFTRFTVRLLPLPENKKTFLLLFNSINHAAVLVADILRNGFVPCTLEYMDKTAIKVVRDRLDFTISEDIEALLLLEFDGSISEVERAVCLFREFMSEHKVAFKEAETDTEVASLWQARRAISPATFSLKPHKISEDVVVPRTKIPELVVVTAGLAEKYSLTILTFGHAGDGNIHVNIMVDKDDKAEYKRGVVAKEELFKAVLAMGGSLSGEHGVGTTKSPFVPLEIIPETLALQKRIKKCFDPDNILNPGKIFPIK